MTAGAQRPANPEATPRVHRTVEVMGTVVSLDIRDVHLPGAHDVLAAGAALLTGMDRDFSTYKDGSWISRLARHDVEESELPDRVRDVLALCDSASDRTGGWFSSRWRGAGTDPTGLMKGWAADRVSDLFLARGCPDHCVNAAGDIVLSGSPAPGLRWRVGIADPRAPGGLLGFVDGTGGTRGPSLGGPERRWSVATSGPAERGPQVVDPFTGHLATNLLSATVVGHAGAETDAHATALIASGGSAALQRQLHMIGSITITVDTDGLVQDPLGYLHPLPLHGPPTR